ncbi:hypothetical protein O181_025981 [Austropuccinia psidii MF-1]|uniref:Uncharacterized protein n=1 Tax=Austropuccinia psidii MF-1 TaxID=1389203 RepID=A0A9Q3H030_9BASI|nr:hypothetical protein [Austropuccinia psidii MF-1]
MSAKELIRKFSKEHEEFTKKMIDKSNPPPKQKEKRIIDDHKDEKAATIAQIEEWGSWKPPQLSHSNENLKIKLGLRQKRQEIQSQTQKEDKIEKQNSLKKDTRCLP